jgi:hypothetical protein
MGLTATLDAGIGCKSSIALVGNILINNRWVMMKDWSNQNWIAVGAADELWPDLH